MSTLQTFVNSKVSDMVKPTSKSKRIPVGGRRNILTVANKDPNLVYRWVLDSPGRLEDFKMGGYSVVSANPEVGDATVDRASKLGSAVTMVRGSATLVLMSIPREWYDEDQKAKQDSIDALEETMRSDSAGDYGAVSIARK